MKYRLTWSDVIIAFFWRYFIVGFPLFVLATLFLTLGLLLIQGDLFHHSTQSFIREYFYSLPVVLFIYFVIMLVFFGLSCNYWKQNIIGEHSLYFEGDFFVWEGKNQQVRTSLGKLKKVKIGANSFTLKFQGSRSAKVKKKWCIEGYDEYISELEKISEEKGIIIQKV